MVPIHYGKKAPQGEWSSQCTVSSTSGRLMAWTHYGWNPSNTGDPNTLRVTPQKGWCHKHRKRLVAPAYCGCPSGIMAVLTQPQEGWWPQHTVGGTSLRLSPLLGDLHFVYNSIQTSFSGLYKLQIVLFPRIRRFLLLCTYHSFPLVYVSRFVNLETLSLKMFYTSEQDLLATLYTTLHSIHNRTSN